MMREYCLPLLDSFAFAEFLKPNPSVSDADVTPEYYARHNWLLGSSRRVIERLEQVYPPVRNTNSPYSLLRTLFAIAISDILAINVLPNSLCFRRLRGESYA
jgi:hypothetical protein